jgi:hypothetical protein
MTSTTPNVPVTVSPVIPVGVAAFTLACLVFAAFGVELPDWLYWNLGGLIAAQLILSLVRMTGRREGDDDGEPAIALDDGRPGAVTSVRAEAAGPESTGIQTGWRWRR